MGVPPRRHGWLPEHTPPSVSSCLDQWSCLEMDAANVAELQAWSYDLASSLTVKLRGLWPMDGDVARDFQDPG